MTSQFSCKSGSSLPYSDEPSSTPPLACSNVNSKFVGDLTLYSSIVGILLFFIHVGYTYFKCKKFSANSGALLLITLVFIVTIFLIFSLTAKVSTINPETAIDDQKYTEGEYLSEPGTGRNLMYMQVIGNIIFLIVLVFIAIKNKSILIGCEDSFPWITAGVLVSTEALMILYGLLKLI